MPRRPAAPALREFETPRRSLFVGLVPRVLLVLSLSLAPLCLAPLLSTPLAAQQGHDDAPTQTDEHQTDETQTDESEPTERTLGPQPYDPADPVVPPAGEEDAWGYEAVEGEADDAAQIEPEGGSSVEIVRARRKGELGHRWVQSISRWEPGAARPSWSAQGDKVAFDAAGDLGYRALYVRDLATGTRQCLSCELWQLREKNVHSPAWHPSGDWIFVVVQDLPRRLLPDPARMASFHRALHAELWVLTADGRNAWQLTQSSPQGRAVHEARVSFEGDRIAWSERVDSRAGLEGAWVVRLARLDLGKVPSFEKDQTLRPTSWPSRIVVEGFTEDDSGLWLSLTRRDRKGSQAARYDLETLRLEPVDTGGTWDLEARTVPRGERIVLASDRNLDAGRALPYTGDLWFTTPLGLRQERLTFFNDPSSGHYLGETLIGDAAWSPDGRSVLLSLVSNRDGVTEDALWRVDFSAALQGTDEGPR